MEHFLKIAKIYVNSMFVVVNDSLFVQKYGTRVGFSAALIVTQNHVNSRLGALQSIVVLRLRCALSGHARRRHLNLLKR